MATATSAEANKALVRELYEGMSEGRDDDILALYAAECVIHGLPGTQNDQTGREAMKKQLRGTREAFPDIAPSIELMLAEGDLVAARLAYTATHQGDYLGVPATGKEVRFHGTVLFRIDDGAITEVWGSIDALGVLRQLGATELPET